MEVNLLLLGNLQSCPEMQQVPRPTIFRKVARVFDKGVPRFRQLTIYKERRFASHVSCAALSGPIHREHSGRRPVCGHSARPRHLQSRIVPAAGHAVGPGRKTEEQDRRDIEPVRWTKLLFYAQGEVTESRA